MSRKRLAKKKRDHRPIRFMTHKQARKAGQWVIKKYNGAFKKLAEI